MMQDVTTRFLLTVEETAHLLSLSRMSVYRLIQRGDLPSIKIGGSRRVSMSALRAYLQKLEAASHGTDYP